jgi:hypothetical protein
LKTSCAQRDYVGLRPVFFDYNHVVKDITCSINISEISEKSEIFEIFKKTEISEKNGIFKKYENNVEIRCFLCG